MGTIGHLPVTIRGHWWVLTTKFRHTLYVFAIPMKERSTDNVMQVYLLGLLLCNPNFVDNRIIGISV